MQVDIRQVVAHAMPLRTSRIFGGISRLVDFNNIHSLHEIELVLMDEGHNAFEIERQAFVPLVEHDWDLDELHLAVIGHRLAEALMLDDHPGYRHWHEVYSSAVRLAASDDPILVFRWLVEHPDLPIPDDQT